MGITKQKCVLGGKRNDHHKVVYKQICLRSSEVASMSGLTISVKAKQFHADLNVSELCENPGG